MSCKMHEGAEFSGVCDCYSRREREQNFGVRNFRRQLEFRHQLDFFAAIGISD
jgi:hypothetical protein